jgi:hypothetical protein
MITALCNVYINSPLKLKLFKDTFPSVYEVSDNWLIYFRGRFRKDAEIFVKNLDTQSHTVIFEDLNDGSWASSVKEMLKYSRYNYIYIYIEDHFLVESLDIFKEVIKDAIQNNLDYFSYSFFNAEIDLNALEAIYPEYSKYFAFFELSKSNHDYFKKNYRNLFPFSLVSVVSKKYFSIILRQEFYHNILLLPLIQNIMWKFRLRYPINRILLCKINKLLNLANIRITLYTPSSPLNMEKSIYEMDGELLPLKTGIVNRELLANFDDDNGAANGSMIKRGKYPKRLKAEGMTEPIDLNELKQYKIGAAEIVNRQFYLKSSRQATLYLKYLYVNEGRIGIRAGSEDYVINEHEFIYIYANIPHTIEGLQDSRYSIKIIPDESWAVGDYF